MLNKITSGLFLIYLAGLIITAMFGPEPNCDEKVVETKLARIIVSGNSVDPEKIKFSRNRTGLYCTKSFNPTGRSDGTINYRTSYGFRFLSMDSWLWPTIWLHINPHPYQVRIRIDGRWTS